MAEKDWMEILGWSQKELSEMRAVAYSYIRQGGYETALTFFDALLVLSPQNPYDLQTVGALHLQMGKPLQALEFLDRALKLAPEHLLSQLNRAKALFLLGYKKQGITQASLLEGCPDKEIAKQASALLLAYQ